MNEDFSPDGNNKEIKVDFLPLDTAEKLEKVRQIASVVWPETYKDILTAEQIIYMMEMMYSPSVMEKELSEGYVFILCTVNGQDAGYISYSACKDVPGRAKLHKVYLLHAFHHKGIGQKMLLHACEKCRKENYSSLCLAVNKQNLNARKAYNRAGFSVEKSVCCDIGNGFVMDDYIMVKDL